MPILNNHLEDVGYTPRFISITISEVALVYALSVSFVLFLGKILQKRAVLWIGLALMITGVELTGMPLDHDNHLSEVILLGNAVFGLGFSMVTIPVMPEIIEAIEGRYLKGSYDEQTLYNNISGYFVMCQAAGESFGPFLSSILELNFNFRPTQHILFWIIISFLALYFLCCEPRKFFSRPDSESTEKEQRESLISKAESDETNFEDPKNTAIN